MMGLFYTTPTPDEPAVWVMPQAHNPRLPQWGANGPIALFRADPRQHRIDGVKKVACSVCDCALRLELVRRGADSWFAIEPLVVGNGSVWCDGCAPADEPVALEGGGGFPLVVQKRGRTRSFASKLN